MTIKYVINRLLHGICHIIPHKHGMIWVFLQAETGDDMEKKCNTTIVSNSYGGHLKVLPVRLKNIS